jgi:hypothetical protein
MLTKNQVSDLSKNTLYDRLINSFDLFFHNDEMNFYSILKITTLQILL